MKSTRIPSMLLACGLATWACTSESNGSGSDGGLNATNSDSDDAESGGDDVDASADGNTDDLDDSSSANADLDEPTDEDDTDRDPATGADAPLDDDDDGTDDTDDLTSDEAAATDAENPSTDDSDDASQDPDDGLPSSTDDENPPSSDDTASEDQSADDANDTGTMPEPPEGSVPMFVAAGAGGRRVTSCDDGLTWIADDIPQPNFDDYDHHEWLVRGLAYGEGAFVSFHGWGSVGRILRTVDGIEWNEVFPVGEQAFANGFWGAAYGDGAFVGVGSAAFIRSTDSGQTWGDPDWLNVDDGHTLVAYGDGTFVAIQPGQSVRSQTAGAAWEPAIAFDCPMEAIAYGGGVFVTHGFDGSTCRSDDAGQSWQPGNNTGVGGEGGGVLWTGDEFIALGQSISRSPDGSTWTPGGSVGLSAALDIAISAETNTLVATAVGPTRLMRSTDGGDTWDATLEGDPFFRQVEFGYGLPSPECPAR